MKKTSGARMFGIITVAGLLTMAAGAQAQQVTLKSSDGTVNMTGDFVNFQDNAYVIQTALGQLRVSASRVSCTGAACPDLNSSDADFVVAGSDGIGLGLMPLVIEGYAGARNAAASFVNTGSEGAIVADLISDQGFGDDLVAIRVASSSTSDGLEQLRRGEAEIAMADRRILPDEARALRDSGAGNMISPDQEHIVAIDSLIIITNPNNPIDSLDVRQLGGIYSGQITNWSQVGGPDLPIEVVIRDVGAQRTDSFTARLFGDSGATLTRDATFVPTSSDVSLFVNQNPGGIGVVGYAFQRGASAVNIVNQCGITMSPDAFSAKTEEYALQQRLFLYARQDTTNPQVEDFLDFVTSPEADSVIRKAGFIGFSVDRREQSFDDSRARALLDPNADPFEGGYMRQMLSRMVDYDRLSTTFRFRTGSAQLDERGEIDKERLIDYLATQPNGSEVLFVGFTDSVGEFSGNLDLSQRRAAQVAEEVESFAGSRLNGINFTSVGYSEIAPSGCNASEEGRRINRRVEVWIKSPA
ncbi:substrate-binding domain-containing protein [Loktanella agnita]|uniref:substrate-binding domain-containing protein n=1 Tax=Loktanella agnita TaxID=287097 RepID=UPI003988F0FC